MFWLKSEQKTFSIEIYRLKKNVLNCNSLDISYLLVILHFFMYKYIKEPIKYGLRSHSFSWCVSDGVCCARRPGSGSARTLCGHGRSVSAQLLLPISQQAPQSHPHSSCAAADGGELAVCLPASLWRGSCEGAQAFCRHPGLTCQQNTTEMKFGWCRKFVSLGDGPVTHPIRENIVISCP